MKYEIYTEFFQLRFDSLMDLTTIPNLHDKLYQYLINT